MAEKAKPKTEAEKPAASVKAEESQPLSLGERKGNFYYTFRIVDFDNVDAKHDHANKLETAKQALNQGWYAVDEPVVDRVGKTSEEAAFGLVSVVTYKVKVVPNIVGRPNDGWLDQQNQAGGK